MMTVQQKPLAPSEAIELLEKELGLTTSEAIAWLKKHFGAIGGMDRAEVMVKIAKIKAQLRKYGITSEPDAEEQEPDDGLSL